MTLYLINHNFVVIMNASYRIITDNFCNTLQKHLEGELVIQHFSNSLMKINHDKLPFSIYIYGEDHPKREVVRPEKSIHIDIDTLVHKSEIVLRRILSIALNKQKAYARQTVVARVDKKNSIAFLDENHLQGAMPGKYRYGLFLEGELISLAVFSGGRRMPEDKPADYRSFELIRFCNKLGYNVIGGISKLIKAFIKDFDPGDLMTYTDKDWSQESSLEKIGFFEKSETNALKYWISNNERFLIRDELQFERLKETYPKGYIKENMGSLKMILSLK